MKSYSYSKFGAYQAGVNLLFRMRYAGAGYKLACGMFTGILGYTYLKGPELKSEIYRCGLAGIASTLVMEVACQPIDTLNMKAKVEKKFVFIQFIKRKGMKSLMRGIQPVVYGMAASSFLYFILYKRLKDFAKVKMDAHNIDKTSLSSVFLMSAGASTLANLCAIGLYYPFDLVKTRMQVVGEYKYRNIVDAFYKIRKESTSKWKIQNFFRGLSLYSLTFITFTTLEFSIYETLMMYLSERQKPKVQNHNLGLAQVTHEDESNGLFEHKEDKQVSHILIASAIAGAIGGLVTNPLEFLVVNKQANSKIKVKQMFKNHSMYDIIFKGSLFRTAYYSTQAVLIFFLLEKFGKHLDCEI